MPSGEQIDAPVSVVQFRVFHRPIEEVWRSHLAIAGSVEAMLNLRWFAALALNAMLRMSMVLILMPPIEHGTKSIPFYL